MNLGLYDVVIIGGGIGGLYVAYELLKRTDLRILILEKNGELGGRVYTYKDDKMTVDAGAGRFSSSHTLFISLLKELGLFNKKSKNGNSVAHCYIDPSTRTSQIMNSILDYHYMNLSKNFFAKKSDSVTKGLLDITTDMVLETVNQTSLPNVGLIARVLAVGALTSKKTLIQMTFLEFARTVLKADEIDFLLGSFGYYSELVIMNAYDCMKLLLELNPAHTFYSLRGGLSSVIEELSKRIREKGGDILLKKTVEKIVHHDNARENMFSISGLGSRGGVFTCSGKRVVCAVTNKELMKFSIFRPIEKITRGILSSPLCRIYAKYPVSVVGGSQKGSVWFRGLPKLTVNNFIRMIIPISEKDGIIMISYSDNLFAEYWKKLYNRSGEQGVNRRLKQLVFEALGKEIPDAEEIKVFFWPYGVGYWGVGTDSSLVSSFMIQPFVKEDNKQLFVCGENFSENYQQWMEGALDTGSQVIRRILDS